jgi:hypothetical protein
MSKKDETQTCSSFLCGEINNRHAYLDVTVEE